MKHTRVFQRREKILQILRQRGEASIEQLIEQMGVSGWTIRRDLTALEEIGQVQRRYGSVVLTESAQPVPLLEINSQKEAAAKVAIGRTAAQLIASGQFVALAAGATTTQVALALRGRQGISIMTNALNIAQDLSRESGIHLTCAGGEVHGDYYTLTGPVTERALSMHYYDVAVISVSGVSIERGLTVSSQANASSIGIMLHNANQRIVVADHTKFGAVSSVFLAQLADVDVIVTDTVPLLSFRQHLESVGTTLVIANLS